MSIYEALSAVKDELGAVSKGNTMKGGSFSYKYRSIDDVLNALHPILVKHGVVGPVPSLVEHRQSGKKSVVIYGYTFFHKDGSSISGAAAGEGDDSGDKGTNKASTGALKTFLTQALAIPFDTDDPDHYPSAPADKPAVKSAEKTNAPKQGTKPAPSAPVASNEKKCGTCTYAIGANDPLKRKNGEYHHKACLDPATPGKVEAPANANDITSILDTFGTEEN